MFCFLLFSFSLRYHDYIFLKGWEGKERDGEERTPPQSNHNFGQSERVFFSLAVMNVCMLGAKKGRGGFKKKGSTTELEI